MLFGLFVTTTLLVPTAFINKPIFVTLILMIFFEKITSQNHEFKIMSAFLVILGIFSYGFIFSLVGDTDKEIARQYFFTIFVLFLVNYIERFHINIERVIEVCGIIFLIVIGLYFLCITGPDFPYANFIISFLKKYNNAGVDYRAQLYLNSANDLKTYVLGATPFLFLPWSIVVMRFSKKRTLKDLILLSAFAVAILLSGSRALITVSFVALVVITQFKKNSYKKLLSIGLIGYLLYLFANYLLQDTLILDTNEVSNAAKIRHIQSFIHNLNWSRGIFGQGLASYFYSTGSGSYRSYTEITPMDMMRYFGIPLTCCLYFCIFFPSQKFSNYLGENKWRLLIIVLYTIMSMSNPVMFNSFGMLVVLWYWAKIRETKEIT